MRPRLLPFAVLCALAFGAASPAAAHPGVRFGLTDDPDSIFLGFFYEAIVGGRSGAVALEPGVDLGFGDDADFFTVRGALRGKYLVPIDRRLLLYPLIGVSLYYVNLDDCSGDACDDTEVGLDIGGGLRFGRINLELIAGLEDIPELTFQVGFLF